MNVSLFWKKGIIVIGLLMVALALLFAPRAINSLKKGRVKHEIAASGVQFPLTIRDAVGRDVVIPAKPQRIVALSPSLTEIIYSLHAEDRLVGNSRYCNFPPAAHNITKIGGIVDPSLEALKALKPDIVICTAITPTRIIQSIEAMQITIVVFDHQQVGELMRDIDLLGKVIGSHAEAQAYLIDFRKRLDVVEKRTREMKSHPSAVILYGLDDLPIAGKNSFSGEILKVAGGVNFGAKTGLQWTKLSMESLVKWDPDVIFINSDSSEEKSGELTKRAQEIRNDSRWKTISAVRNGHIYVLYNSLASVPGPRTIDLAEQMQAALLKVNGE